MKLIDQLSSILQHGLIKIYESNRNADAPDGREYHGMYRFAPAKKRR
jgi:hypothetical protein